MRQTAPVARGACSDTTPFRGSAKEPDWIPARTLGQRGPEGVGTGGRRRRGIGSLPGSGLARASVRAGLISICRVVTATVALSIPASGYGANDTGRFGEVRGRVVDRGTQGPLPGAVVRVLDEERETSTDGEGAFALGNLRVGVHRLRVETSGYEAAVVHDVVVRSNRITALRVELQAAMTGGEEVVVVTADYFDASEKSDVSNVRFAYEEIRRSPGSAGDVSRMLQALPSVNIGSDQRNDLIVRGGSPAESLTVVDNIEVPSINHFPTQGASGGAVGILNTDLIADVSFSSGGFSAEHGDRLSSVMVVTQREGNRSELEGEVNASVAGTGLVLEGPLREGRGSWIMSARRSFLDLVVGALGTGGVVPSYSDLQATAVYDVNARHRMGALAIGSFDDFHEDDNDGEIVARTKQYVTGVNWRWLWSDAGYGETSLAYTRGGYGLVFRDRSTDEGDGRLRLDNSSVEQEVVVRSNWHYQADAGLHLSWGVNARRSWSDFDVFETANATRVNVVDEGIDVRGTLRSRKLGAFAQMEKWLGERVTAGLGARFDYFSLNRQGTWSPRLDLAYRVDPRTTLTTAAGTYYQTLPAWLAIQHPENQLLPNQRADHYVVGVRHRLTPSTQLSVEAYRKDYGDSPFDPDDPTALVVDGFADFRTPVPGQLVLGGEGRAQGVEALVQKKLARRIYGLASYAYSVSRYTDLEGVVRHRTFDNRHVASLILGYRPSVSWEYSARWIYASGRPYSPFDPVLSARAGVGVIQRSRVNSERHTPYHRLDVRLDYRKHLEDVNLVSFVSVLNAYNRDNVLRHYWSAGRRRTGRSSQFGLVPIAGLEIEF